MSTFVYGKNLVVLRRKKDRMALNVSYSLEGLHWTCNKLGRALFFKRAFVSLRKIIGDLAPSEEVYVERFNPSTPVGASKEFVGAECTWAIKALRL